MSEPTSVYLVVCDAEAQERMSQITNVRRVRVEHRITGELCVVHF